MLNRKDYKAITEIVKKNTVRTSEIMVCVKRANMVYDLADYFAQDNPRFDRDRFLEACGLRVRE